MRVYDEVENPASSAQDSTKPAWRGQTNQAALPTVNGGHLSEGDATIQLEPKIGGELTTQPHGAGTTSLFQANSTEPKTNTTTVLPKELSTLERSYFTEYPYEWESSNNDTLLYVCIFAFIILVVLIGAVICMLKNGGVDLRTIRELRKKKKKDEVRRTPSNPDFIASEILPDLFVHKGHLVVEKYEEPQSHHALENDAPVDLGPNPKVTWQEQHEVVDFGSDVEEVISNRSGKKNVAPTKKATKK